MSFVNMSALGMVAAVLFLFFVTVLFIERSYFKWVRKYFFLRKSMWSKFSSLIFLVSFIGIGISVLDLRGPEESVTTNIVDQKTIIMIDASSSMLAEDVRPNRFAKSLLMARHFVKKAIGHQISVVVFSNTQKRVVPFTDDVDMLDGRIDALSTLDLRRGGSNISTAIMESVQYFKSESDDENFLGNILLFTDSEDHDDIELKVPDSIHLAVVGVGTLSGGPIPLRNDQGQLVANKLNKGKEVITKLDEEFLKSIGNHAKYFKYWIALSYSIPTEEILDFFRGLYKIKSSRGEMRSRPVFSHYILMGSIFLMVVSLLLRWKRSLVPVCLMFCINFTLLSKEDQKPVNPLIEKYESKLREGKISLIEKQKLAEMYLKSENNERALTLYKESMPRPSEAATEALFNYGTALLKAKKYKEAISQFEAIMERSVRDDVRTKVRNNILKSLQLQEEEQKEKNNQEENGQEENKDKSESKDQDKKDNKESKGTEKDQQNDQENDGKSAEQKKEKSKQEQSKQGKGKEDKKKDQKSEDDKKAEQDKDNEKSKTEADEQKKPEEKQQTVEEYEENLRQKRNMVKVPAMMKQLLNEDRDLQKRYLDSTDDTRGQRAEKDW